jgi:phosphate butyryltransferase
MFNNFEQISNGVAAGYRPKLVVAAAAESELLKAVFTARKTVLSGLILIGKQQRIRDLIAQETLDPADTQIIDCDDPEAACEKAVALVRQGQADFIMKGLVDTAIFLKAVINKTTGLMTGQLLSSVMIMRINTYHKFLLVTDGGMVINPDYEQKQEIIKNAVNLARLLGIQPVKIACLAAKEKVNPKMPATIDAAALKEWGKIYYTPADAIVDGPLAMDLIVSKKAAQIKAVVSEVAGDADVILTPNIETGNAVFKAMVHLGQAESAGVVMGACVPIILTSRSDSCQNKLNSITLGTYLAQNMGDCHKYERSINNEKVINRK